LIKKDGFIHGAGWLKDNSMQKKWASDATLRVQQVRKVNVRQEG
jgi:hypothetical protein